MSDRLDDLPEGSSGDSPVLDAYFDKPKNVKRSWKDYLKILGISILSFALAANPITGLFLSKIGIFQGAYQNFFGQMLLFLIVFGLALWYF